jgi:lipopolysaccharide/colanic/teichoic acid biosynthesis glycosyltransferase
MPRVKRLIDVCGAAAGLVLAAPLHPLIALSIRLDSPGPVLFRQRRVSGVAKASEVGIERYRTFTLLKYRTMRVDAERVSGPVLAERDDPRTTRVGRVLRQTRLDELPQLWNVLRGDMSLVGPRPERPEFLLALARAVPAFDECSA